MTRLTPEGADRVSAIAARHGVSTDAAETLLAALVQGGGTQAQFSHPDLGGMGQWSRGGMTMVGDMFNNRLKMTVDALCSDLSALLAEPGILAPQDRATPTGTQSQSQSSGGGASFSAMGGFAASQWPEELGRPSSTGSQNNMRYAIFPATRRLAIDFGGRTEVFDTGDHVISGMSQQQGGDQSLTFTSQFGLVRVADLPRVEMGKSATFDEPDGGRSDPEIKAAPGPTAADMPAPEAKAPELSPADMPDLNRGDAARPAAAPDRGSQPTAGADEIIGLIRKLADLRDGGILSETEFETKKAELLARL